MAGSVRLKGRELIGLGEEELRALRGNRIAMIFQDPMMTLNPVLRIDTQMIETVQAHSSVDRASARELARAALARVGIPAPEKRLETYPHELSGGMRQRVAIAIAFINKPDLIIADEPTTALDVTIQSQILYEAQKLCQETRTGDDLDHARPGGSLSAGRPHRRDVRRADRRAGAGGRGHRPAAAPLHQRPARLGAERQPAGRALGPDPRHAALVAQAPGGLQLSSALPEGCSRVRSRAGRDGTAIRPAGALLPPGPGRSRAMTAGLPVPLVEARGLSKRFVKSLDLAGRLAARLGAGAGEATVHAVDCVSLAIAKGEVVGLVGESGCGKSTLGRMISGLLEPTEGEVLFKGKARSQMSTGEARAARLAVQMIFQDPHASLNPRARVEAIIGEAPRVHGLVALAELSALRR